MAEHYHWWGYVRYIVREYPARKSQNLFGTARIDQNAVQKAVDDTRKTPGGGDKLDVIDRLHWSRTHTLDGVSRVCHCGRNTAARWQRKFFEAVAKNRGLMD